MEVLQFKELIESRKKAALENEPVVGPMPLHSMFSRGSVSLEEVKWVYQLRRFRSLRLLDM